MALNNHQITRITDTEFAELLSNYGHLPINIQEKVKKIMDSIASIYPEIESAPQISFPKGMDGHEMYKRREFLKRAWKMYISWLKMSDEDRDKWNKPYLWLKQYKEIVRIVMNDKKWTTKRKKIWQEEKKNDNKLTITSFIDEKKHIDLWKLEILLLEKYTETKDKDNVSRISETSQGLKGLLERYDELSADTKKKVEDIINQVSAIHIDSRLEQKILKNRHDLYGKDWILTEEWERVKKKLKDLYKFYESSCNMSEEDKAREHIPKMDHRKYEEATKEILTLGINFSLDEWKNKSIWKRLISEEIRNDMIKKGEEHELKKLEEYLEGLWRLYVSWREKSPRERREDIPHISLTKYTKEAENALDSRKAGNLKRLEEECVWKILLPEWLEEELPQEIVQKAKEQLDLVWKIFKSSAKMSFGDRKKGIEPYMERLDYEKLVKSIIEKCREVKQKIDNWQLYLKKIEEDSAINLEDLNNRFTCKVTISEEDKKKIIEEKGTYNLRELEKNLEELWKFYVFSAKIPDEEKEKKKSYIAYISKVDYIKKAKQIIETRKVIDLDRLKSEYTLERLISEKIDEDIIIELGEIKLREIKNNLTHIDSPDITETKFEKNIIRELEGMELIKENLKALWEFFVLSSSMSKEEKKKKNTAYITEEEYLKLANDIIENKRVIDLEKWKLEKIWKVMPPEWFDDDISEKEREKIGKYVEQLWKKHSSSRETFDENKPNTMTEYIWNNLYKSLVSKAYKSGETLNFDNLLHLLKHINLIMTISWDVESLENNKRRREFARNNLSYLVDNTDITSWLVDNIHHTILLHILEGEHFSDFSDYLDYIKEESEETQKDVYKDLSMLLIERNLDCPSISEVGKSVTWKTMADFTEDKNEYYRELLLKFLSDKKNLEKLREISEDYIVLLKTPWYDNNMISEIPDNIVQIIKKWNYSRLASLKYEIKIRTTLTSFVDKARINMFLKEITSEEFLISKLSVLQENLLEDSKYITSRINNVNDPIEMFELVRELVKSDSYVELDFIP